MFLYYFYLMNITLSGYIYIYIFWLKRLYNRKNTGEKQQKPMTQNTTKRNMTLTPTFFDRLESGNGSNSNNPFGNIACGTLKGTTWIHSIGCSSNPMHH